MGPCHQDPNPNYCSGKNVGIGRADADPLKSEHRKDTEGGSKKTD